MAEIDAAVLNSLAEKIDSLELTDAEQSVIDQVLDRSAAYEPEVEGFALTRYSGLTSGADLSATALKLGSALQLVGSSRTFMMERPPPP